MHESARAMTAPEPVSAHALLIEQHAFLRRLARSLVSDPERADDLAQDVAVLALRHPPRPGSSARAWLARVLRNRATSVARSESRRRDRETQLPQPAPQPTPPELEARLRVQRAVIEAVARLEEPYRSAILLRYDQDLSPTAIAERLGVPVATVKTRLARALERLRHDLDARDEPGTPIWSVVLLVGLSDVRPQGAVVAAAAGGALVVSKLAWTGVAVAAALAGTWWTLREPARVEPTSQDLTGDAPRPAGGPSEPATVSVASIEPSDARTAAPASNAQDTASPDWALLLGLTGLTDERSGSATVSIFDGRSDEPRLRFERELHPSWTIDVGMLFDGVVERPAGLRIVVDHPMYLPAEIQLVCPADWSESAIERGRLEGTIPLVVPKAIVTGEVRWGEAAPDAALCVAIYAMARDRPAQEPVDRVALDGSRRYRLRADDAEEHVVVAWVEDANGLRSLAPSAGGSLRPASSVLRLPRIGQNELELEPLLLQEGAVISGRMHGDTALELLASCAPDVKGGRMRRSLIWLGDRFENGPVAASLGPDSTFTIPGLAPIDYVLSPNAVMRASSEDRDNVYRFLSNQDSEVHVQAPARDVRLEFRWVDVVFEVIGGGMPVPRAGIRFLIEQLPERAGFTPSSHATETGENGRLRLQCDPRHALHVTISDPRYEPKEFRFDVAQLVSGAEFRLEFDGPAIAPPLLVLSYSGDLAELGQPDGIGFTAFDCSGRSGPEVEAALSTAFLAERGPGWPDVPAIHLGRVRWAADHGTWSTDELRPGRYLIATRRAMIRSGVHSEFVGSAFVVDLPAGSTVRHAWSGSFGGTARLTVQKSRADSPDLLSGWIDDAAGVAVPVLLTDIGGRITHSRLDRPGSYVVVPAMPPGDYVLQLNLRGGVTRRIPFRVNPAGTTDVYVDLSEP
jgi:RNA polymerase sigma factor (sigma-70 family)